MSKGLIITHGKNNGRVNATTSKEQAIKEAQSKWIYKKEHDGFYTIQEYFTKDDNDNNVVIHPMLAHTFKHKRKTIDSPFYVQPKIDGVRAIVQGPSIDEHGAKTPVKIWSRGGLEYHHLDHFHPSLNRA